jgi:hypothetical protein
MLGQARFALWNPFRLMVSLSARAFSVPSVIDALHDIGMQGRLGGE